ncbi:hypothetical protein PRIPAC_76130 [Pristionchus pacificus]|uniref:C2H2-type domain-containing protein n=1 Tax=Pristionchus pacificus TaxID=54126 RepID=A0A2A6CST7_PRIPA|nr:hypothetical protein PRIPAC_76130 [Pristionchus pacificus]|eukprot:PDM81282.1 hypothetical protein PRIPAC_36285 [Pristionchus pacificus]
MSSPENVDPVDEMSSASPESQEPRKTRYGRIIVRKGNLPGEDEIPKIRMKKKINKPEEPIKPKRKYTKRKIRTQPSDEKEVTIPVNGNHPVEVKKEIKEEEPDLYEMESEGGEHDDNNPPRQVATYNSNITATDQKEACDLCGMVMEAYKMEIHKLDNHPEHLCSNGRIGCDVNGEAPVYREVIEAAFFRKCYQPVECPYCRIYLASYFDLDLHFIAHGLAQFDAKFACTGCNVTFISVETLKKHLTKQNTPRQSLKCFNSARVLNRMEIDKLKLRFSDADRKDCIRKFDLDTYVLAPPKILECVQESTCAFCNKRTKAYAHLKTDLSNLFIYGLECCENTEKEIIEKISHCKEKFNDRVSVCRHHFQWRNWQTKKIEEVKPKVVERKKIAEKREAPPAENVVLAQKVIRRMEETMVKEENDSGVAFMDETRKDNPTCSDNRPKQVKLEPEDDYEEVLFDKKKEIKKEEPSWDEDINRDRSEMEYDVIDISDDDFGSQDDREAVSLPVFLNKDELEEKVSTRMKIGHKCPVCEESFPNLNDLHGHQSAHPETRLLYSCADCPSTNYLHPDEISKHFEEKMKSALAGFYSYKVNVHSESLSNIQSEKVSNDNDKL